MINDLIYIPSEGMKWWFIELKMNLSKINM